MDRPPGPDRQGRRHHGWQPGHRQGDRVRLRRARRRRRDRQPQARQLPGRGRRDRREDGPQDARRRHPRRAVGRVQRASPTRVLETFGRCDILVNNAGMSPLYAERHRHHRGVLRQGPGREPEGPVRPQPAPRRAHVRPRRRRDPQHLDGRVDPHQPQRGRLRHGQVGPQRDDRRPRRRLRAEGAGQLHPAGRDPHRHLQGVERGDDRQRPQDADGPRRLRRGLPGRRAVLRQRGVGVDHRHVPARRRRRGPPAGAL